MSKADREKKKVEAKNLARRQERRTSRIVVEVAKQYIADGLYDGEFPFNEITKRPAFLRTMKNVAGFGVSD